MNHDEKIQRDTLEILASVGAIVTDTHVIYTSGKHGSTYVNKDALYPHLEPTFRVTQWMADLVLKGLNESSAGSLDAVVAPVLGGVVLSQWVGYHLGNRIKRPVMALYAEKVGTVGTEGAFAFKRGYQDLIAQKNVVVLEDVLNTGGSLRKVVDAAKGAGATVLGAVVLCNRGGITLSDVGLLPTQAVPAPFLKALVNLRLEAWDPDTCVLCKNDIPMNRSLGKGK
jgi:orotate phosphoribosyltransferase